MTYFTNNGKRWLALLLAVVVSGAAVVGYTMANFSAQTRNPGSVFSSGTLVLSDTVGAGTTCLSTAGGTTDTNVNNACDQLLNVTVRKPGDEAFGTLTLKNEGSLAGSALSLYTNACANSDATGETYHGTGDLCANLQVTVQAYSDAGYTTESACIYGAATGNVCNFSDATKTLTAFTTAYTSGTPLGLGAMAAGSSKYYRIGVKFPASAGNTFQGRTSTFDFTWVLTQ